jgi:hypothetical protein
MSKVIRAKFNVSEVADLRFSAGEGKNRERITMSAVYATGSDAAENVSFAKATPSGTITILVDNPEVFGFFEPGREFYVEFTAAPRRCRECHGGGVKWSQDPVTSKQVQTPCERCNKTGIDPEQT